MATQGNGTRPDRPDQFIRDALAICPVSVQVPDPSTDFGMYQKMDAALAGIHDYLEDMRRNYGRIGFSAQNAMSDLSKAYIGAVQRGDEVEMSYIDRAMEKLTTGFNEVECSELPENPTQFGRTIWQEQMEATLFGKIWSVISGKSDSVPDITSWKGSEEERFGGNVQAYLYGFLDVVSELSKALDDEEFSRRKEITTEQELALYERYIVIAESITLRLSQERHFPGYVIANGYGRWVAYSNKLRTAYGAIGYKKREYNLRRSMQRMNAVSLTKIRDGEEITEFGEEIREEIKSVLTGNTVIRDGYIYVDLHPSGAPIGGDYR